MRSFKGISLIVLSTALVFSAAGCASKTDGAGTSSVQTSAAGAETSVQSETDTETVSASEAAASGETEAPQFDVEADKALIAALDPKKPETLGTVKLGEYKGLELEAAKPHQVTGDDIEYYLIYTVMPNFTEEADQVELGDTVNINYKGLKDGVAFEGGTAENYDLVIGSGSFIDGFESGLIGKKKDEELSLDLTFPEDYHAEELAGQAVVFEVKINSITRQSALTDEIARQIDPEAANIDELKANIRRDMQSGYDHKAAQDLMYTAVKAAAENAEIEVTPEALEWKLDDMIKNYYVPMSEQQYGMDFATVLLFQGMTYSTFREALKSSAESACGQMMVLDAIAEKENIVYDEQAVETFAENYGMTPGILRQLMDEDTLKTSVIEEMANNIIVDNAKITYTEETESAE